MKRHHWQRLPILRHFLPSARKRYWRLKSRNGFALVPFGGATFLLDLNNYLDREIAHKREWEPQQSSILFGEVQSGRYDGFIDVGAHFGFYSILAALRAPDLNVIAFEPSLRAADQLAAGLFLNGLSERVTLHRVALSDAAGHTSFLELPPAIGVRSQVLATSFARNRGVGERVISVPTARGDDMLSYQGGKLILKIDVEGHEIPVINGLDRILRANSCFLQIESFEATFSDLNAAMESRGYRYVKSIESDHYFTNLDREALADAG